MNITKRFLSILLFTAVSVGAWALETDSDGTYLIGSTDDWNAFATLVNNGNTTANAKLTADITVTTMIGSESKNYAGVFDGQTHTLNVTISGSSQFAAPFHYVNGGTIKNLKVEGTVSSSYTHMSGLIGRAYGKISIENCIVAANIYMSSDYAAGFVGNGGSIAYGGPSEVVMRNCLFIGSFTGVSGNRSKASAFWGWGKSTPVFINCLENGTYTNISEFSPYMFEGTDKQNTETTTNSYYKHGSISLDGISNASNMTDGEIVSLLGDGWVLDPITNQPVLNQFTSLKQDADGYYLLGSVQDWDNFAALVETTPSANAKMTADIDLGDDQTMIGSGTRWSDAGELNHHYKGIFDGQGHTLTINYNTSEVFTAPFRHISGATIKNLHVTGTITTNSTIAASIAASCSGISIDSYITNCVSSVNIISNYVNTGRPLYDGARHGGFVGQLFNKARINFNDCVFNGSITGENQNVLWGGFVGLCDGTVRVTNCLQSATFECSNVVSGNTATFATIFGNDISITNGYYLNQLGVAQGTQATAEQLANGTIATALQNGRDEEVWVQDGSTPMLKIFVSNNSGITTSEALLQDKVQCSMLNVQCEGWYTIDGRKLGGKPTTKGIYISKGKKIVVN